MKSDFHIPHNSKLSEYVTAMWEVDGPRHIHETILPQGVVEMVFNLADAMNGLFSANKTSVEAPLAFAQGFNTQTLNVTYSGKQHLFGIRLQPHMVKSLLGISASELKDSAVDLTLLKREYNTIWCQLAELKSFAQRVNYIESKFPILAQTACSRTLKLCSLFHSNDIQNFESLDTLARQVCYSSRHLNRKAQDLFGVSAEELISYKKFLYAVNLIHSHNYPLIEVAFRSGFYDQSHFCRTFKTFANITPKQYRLQKSGLPFHLFS